MGYGEQPPSWQLLDRPDVKGSVASESVRRLHEGIQSFLLMTPLICQTGPKTSANSGCSCSVREKRCISGRNLASGIVGIRS